MNASLDKLRHAGLKITNQRVAVLQFFSDERGHYTPQEVCSALSHRNLKLSTATVYNTLETLEEIGVIQRFNLNGGRTYYDANLHEHHHACCNECGQIIDVEVSPAVMSEFLADQGVEHFNVFRSHIHIQGMCGKCRC